MDKFCILKLNTQYFTKYKINDFIVVCSITSFIVYLMFISMHINSNIFMCDPKIK